MTRRYGKTSFERALYGSSGLTLDNRVKSSADYGVMRAVAKPDSSGLRQRIRDAANAWRNERTETNSRIIDELLIEAHEKHWTFAEMARAGMWAPSAPKARLRRLGLD